MGICAGSTWQQNVEFSAAADFLAAAEGNSITLTQTAPEGNEIGNESVLSQEGDLNVIDVEVVGDANEVMASQMQTGNTFLTSISGNGNLVEAEQDSIQSTAEFAIEGDDNAVSLTQLGDGGPIGFIFNRSINSITGSGNTMSIVQGDGVIGQITLCLVMTIRSLLNKKAIGTSLMYVILAAMPTWLKLSKTAITTYLTWPQ